MGVVGPLTLIPTWEALMGLGLGMVCEPRVHKRSSPGLFPGPNFIRKDSPSLVDAVRARRSPSRYCMARNII